VVQPLIPKQNQAQNSNIFIFYLHLHYFEFSPFKKNGFMKKYILAVLTGCLTIGAASAQQKWTLEQCIEYALKKNITIKSTELTTQTQQIKHEQAKNQRLPDLFASGANTYSFGMSKNNKGIYENTNASSYSVGLSSSLTLFNGLQVKNTIKAKGFSLLASIEDLKKAKESMSVSIASAYLQVLYNKELYLIAEEQVKLSEEQVTRSESLAALGKIPEGQVFEVRAQLAKDKLSATESRSNLQLSLLDLSQLLDLEEWANFDVVEPSIDMQNLALMIQPADEVFKYAVATKSTIKASEYRLKSSEKDLAVTQGTRYPSLSLGASYSNGYYPDLTSTDATTLTTSKVKLSEQLKSNYSTSIGFSLSIPIFNRFDTQNNIRLSKISVESAKLELENSRKTLYKEIQQAWFDAKTASEKYQSSTDAVINSEEACRFAEEKYNNGRATIYEFNEAKMNLVSAKSTQLQAKYNYLFSVKILDFYKGEPLHL
jgi:outer membrane protein